MMTKLKGGKEGGMRAKCVTSVLSGFSFILLVPIYLCLREGMTFTEKRSKVCERVGCYLVIDGLKLQISRWLCPTISHIYLIAQGRWSAPGGLHNLEFKGLKPSPPSYSLWEWSSKKYHSQDKTRFPISNPKSFPRRIPWLIVSRPLSVWRRPAGTLCSLVIFQGNQCHLHAMTYPNPDWNGLRALTSSRSASNWSATNLSTNLLINRILVTGL